MPKYLVFILCMIIISCATKIKINSSAKGAQVYIYDASLNQEKKLGITPLEIKGDDLSSAAGSNDFAFIRISKFGHLPSFILIPVSWDVRGEVSVKLQTVNREYLNDQTRDDYQEIVSKIAFDFLKVQSLMESKKTDKAQKALTHIKQEYGEIAPYYILLGNLYVSQKEYSKALLSYRRGYRLYPKSADIKRAIEFLENFIENRRNSKR